MDGFQILYGRPSVRQDPFPIFSLHVESTAVRLSRLSARRNAYRRQVYIYKLYLQVVCGFRMCSRISVVITAWELNSVARLESALLPLFSISLSPPPVS